jgi:glyoxylase-like metal-dependent hydrolase (beta-lactamase superfamily II)
LPKTQEEVAPFNPSQRFSPSQLVKIGDKMRYGIYTIRRIGEGIYQMNNRDSAPPTGTPGALGVDMYLICGTKKALMIDLGNDFIDGFAGIPARKDAAEEFRTMVHGLAGKLPLELTVTHIHQDHSGMSGAFLKEKTTFWAGEEENLPELKRGANVDPSVYTTFKHGQKTFDLGGGRIVETFQVRGHTNGGTVHILKKDGMLFTGDCFGNGEGLGMRGNPDLTNFAEDTQKFVDYINANFSPYERYALRVYSGHSWENGFQGYNRQEMEHVDVGYLDWRFIQNMLSCAKGVLKGLWLVPDSGLRFVETPNTPGRGNANAAGRGNQAGRGDANQPGKGGANPPGKMDQGTRGNMIYGIGSLMMSLEAAYDAAGLQMKK